MSIEAAKRTILIIDDAMANIKVLGALLQADYRVLFATVPRDGLNKAMSEKPDLILLDVVMPDMDGYEVCRELKADERTADIPIMFITTRTDEEDEVRGLQAGGVDYIAKPFSPAVVTARVRTHVELKRKSDFLEWMLREKSRELREMEAEYTRLFLRR